jgi:hypothetical protein
MTDWVRTAATNATTSAVRAPFATTDIHPFNDCSLLVQSVIHCAAIFFCDTYSAADSIALAALGRGLNAARSSDV